MPLRRPARHVGEELYWLHHLAVDAATTGLVTAENKETDVLRVYHLGHGCGHMERKLANVGADIQRIKGEAE